MASQEAKQSGSGLEFKLHPVGQSNMLAPHTPPNADPLRMHAGHLWVLHAPQLLKVCYHVTIDRRCFRLIVLKSLQLVLFQYACSAPQMLFTQYYLHSTSDRCMLDTCGRFMLGYCFIPCKFATRGQSCFQLVAFTSLQLVLINISDHYTRSRANEVDHGEDGSFRVLGCLLGDQVHIPLFSVFGVPGKIHVPMTVLPKTAPAWHGRAHTHSLDSSCLETM